MRGPVLQYTKNQPGNIDAWRLGEAARCARPGGDLIDHGLSLMKELEDRGYGIVLLRAIDHFAPVTPEPLGNYHEDYGPVLWFTWRDGRWLGEPSWCGTPNDSDWPGYHTHFIPHPMFPRNPE